MLEFFTIGVVVSDAFCDLGVDCFLDDRGDSTHFGSELSDILGRLA